MVALARAQKRLGHDVAAILPGIDGNIAAELVPDGIACHAAPVDMLAAHGVHNRMRVAFALARLLRRLRPDVVHSHILNSVVTARVASWIADAPNCFGGNVGPLSIESDLLRPLEIGTAFCDTKTIASCRYTRELFIQHGVPEDQVELIYYAVDQSGHDPALADGMRVRRELGVADNATLIGKIAYFYPPSNVRALLPAHLYGRGMKGHDVLLRAAPRVLESIPDAKFVLVGRGWGPGGPRYEHDLKALAASLGLRDAVLFPGERLDVPDTLAAFDISVHCSLTDNLAGTVESLLMAKPMVVSDIRGFADTVLHEETGLVVPRDDPNALADAIVRLHRDPALARRLGENGRRWMLERFTLERAVADHEALLARSTARAEQHYRLMTTLVRVIAIPFRLYPVLRDFKRAAGVPGLARRVVRRVKSASRRLLRLASCLVTRGGSTAEPSR
jgi:glycosyltransferase involved in cell wall biosynthesis